jgi:choline dehydrogenase
LSNPASALNQPHDALIVGGGSAGAALAARLSEEPNRRVLLLEAGPSFSPAQLPTELNNPEQVPAPNFDWGYSARGGASTAEMAVPRGRVLGGSSAVNAAVAIRARRQDVESWQANGVEGRAWDEVLESFKALENTASGGDPEGVSGCPVNIVDGMRQSSAVAYLTDEAP